MIIKESAEMYLETILILEKSGPVRSVDIVNKTGFSKPTISVQMKKFHQNGYILIDEHNYITLTPLGRAIAERTYERHQLLTNMLRSMGVDDDTAADDACRIEHYISETTFEKLKEHYETRMQKE